MQIDKKKGVFEINSEDMKSFLDEKVEKYNQPEFIKDDPIQIPHRFSRKEDIEISGFLTATIAWGKRTMILNSANKMMELMDESPYDFVTNHSQSDLKTLKGFVHRTFNSEDLIFFVRSLKRIYDENGGLESVFSMHAQNDTMFESISSFHQLFFENEGPKHRTRKHLANPSKGSAAKRINMYLRWMVRSDSRNVDFGIWKNISPSVLSCPLDVHTANVGRMLGLIDRKQNDWKALSQLDSNLRKFDSEDPVKYDFALFGLGAIEGWK